MDSVQKPSINLQELVFGDFLETISPGYQDSQDFAHTENYINKSIGPVIDYVMKTKIGYDRKGNKQHKCITSLKHVITKEFIISAVNRHFGHLVDLIRNQGMNTPEIKFSLMQTQAILNNAKRSVDVYERTRDMILELVKKDESLKDKYWECIVPKNLPPTGIDIMYVRGDGKLVKGKLIHFFYDNEKGERVLSDIPCIFDEELKAFMSIFINPYWYRTNEVSETTDAE